MNTTATDPRFFSPEQFENAASKSDDLVDWIPEYVDGLGRVELNGWVVGGGEYCYMIHHVPGMPEDQRILMYRGWGKRKKWDAVFYGTEEQCKQAANIIELSPAG